MTGLSAPHNSNPLANPQDLQVGFSSLLRQLIVDGPHWDLGPERSASGLSMVPADIGLVVLANREFVRVDRYNYRSVVIPPGGLGSALLPILLEEGKSGRAITAISWDPSTRHGDLTVDEVEKLQTEHNLSLGLTIRAPRLPQVEGEQYYQGILKGFLWPLCHGFGDTDKLKVIWSDQWQLFRAVNARFAETAAQKTGRGNLFWVHDYQLMLAPKFLRKHVPDSTIGYFHHVPFPKIEFLFGKLPFSNIKEMVLGILGSDLVGFQTASHLTNFVQACRKLGLSVRERRKSDDLRYKYKSATVEIDDRTVRLRVFPISVNVERIQEQLKTDFVRAARNHVREAYPGVFKFVAVERLDYTKGIVEHLEAVRYLLREKPELHGKFVLIQYAAPTDDVSPEYRQYKEKVLRLVEQINQEFSSSTWKPIDYTSAAVPHEKTLALFQAADCVLVTPLIDGMNLSIKEAIVAADPESPDKVPSFILGKGAGAAEELKCLDPIDASDPRAIAAAMLQAYRTRGDDELRHVARKTLQDLKEYLAQNDAQRWYANYLNALYEIYELKDGRPRQAAAQPPLQMRPEGEPLWEQGDLRREKARALGEELASYHPIIWVIDIDHELGRLLAAPPAGGGDGVLPDILRNVIRLAGSDRLVLASVRPFDEIKCELDFFRGYPVIACCAAGGECHDLKLDFNLTELSAKQDQFLTEVHAELGRFIADREMLPRGFALEKTPWGVALRYDNALAENAPEVARHVMNEFFLEKGLTNDKYIVRTRGAACEIVPADCGFDKAMAVISARFKANEPYTTVLIGDQYSETGLFEAVNRAEGRSILVGPLARACPVSDNLDDVESVQLTLAHYLQNILGVDLLSPAAQESPPH